MTLKTTDAQAEIAAIPKIVTPSPAWDSALPQSALGRFTARRSDSPARVDLHERIDGLEADLRELRAQLSPFAKEWWDRHADWFTSRRGSL